MLLTLCVVCGRGGVVKTTTDRNGDSQNGDSPKRRQTETATTIFGLLQTTKTTTNRNDDKQKRRRTETTTRRNDDKPKRRQKLSDYSRQPKRRHARNDEKPKRRQTETPTRRNGRQTKTATTIVTLLPTTKTATVKTTTNQNGNHDFQTVALMKKIPQMHDLACHFCFLMKHLRCFYDIDRR